MRPEREAAKRARISDILAYPALPYTKAEPNQWPDARDNLQGDRVTSSLCWEHIITEEKLGRWYRGARGLPKDWGGEEAEGAEVGAWG